MRLRSVFLSLIMILSLLCTACRFSQPAVSLQLSSPVTQLEQGDTVTLSASLRIPKGLIAPANPVFTWSATGGTLSASTGSSVNFSAPENSGTFRVSVEVESQNLSSSKAIVVFERLGLKTNSQAVLANKALADGEDDVYAFSVSETQNQLLYFELNSTDDVTLELYDDEGDLLARSERASFFSGSGSSFSSLALDTQAIETLSTCRGPCIILPKQKANYFLKIKADDDVRYDLYAFGAAYNDASEPENNKCIRVPSDLNTQTITVNPKTNLLGSIETLNDEDCFETTKAVSSVTLESFEETSIKLRADVFTLEGSLLYSLKAGSGEDLDSLSINSSIPVRIRVSAANGRAAAAFNSRYKLVF